MNKICTTIEQSKKLFELGVDVNTADMWYQHIGYSITDGKEKSTYFPMVIRDNISDDDIPCWSLVALLKLMPFQIIKNNNRFGFYQVKSFNKQGGVYRFGYKTSNNSFLFETSWYNDVIDAAFEMVCWLKKEEYI